MIASMLFVITVVSGVAAVSITLFTAMVLLLIIGVAIQEKLQDTIIIVLVVYILAQL